jgi:signal transduction histidine kinase/DNA-binding response OmpR family regulator
MVRQPTDEQAVLFAGGGEMGARMRAFDWSSTALGPVASWPQSLKTCVRVILTSRQPMFVWWGEQLINLYNDAYKTIVGGKHPEVLGQPASIVWREIWDQVWPRAQSAMRMNEGTYDEALLLIMERHGYAEETYYTFSYSPVPNDQGGTGGILCANTDDTQRIITERQLALLSALSTDTAEARSAEDVCARAAQTFSNHGRDLPFAMIYIADHDKRMLTRVGAAGISQQHAAAAETIAIDQDTELPWARSIHDQQLSIVSEPENLFGPLPSGAWDKPPSQVAFAPIAPSGETGRSGVLVVGLNPYRLFDDSYRGFISLVAGQLAASIANADAYEHEKQRAEGLAELDRAKTAFFSNVSHEFRTPLTLMLGPLADAIAAPSRQLTGENLDTAYRNALRLLRLVNALLDFSRIEAGRAEASFEPTDLAALTTDLASAFRSAIERAGLQFEVDAPPLDEPFYVDHEMWEKIVLNLLSNALKFTFEGTIAVRLRAAGDHVELSVRDTGTGIASHELANVFKRFHRIEGSRSRTHEGSGIGLALVTELVRLHAGSISVASELGAGTTFTVKIPRGRAHLPESRIRSQRMLSSTATGAVPFVQEAERWLPSSRGDGPAIPDELDTPGLSSPAQAAGSRILLADDNADMRDYVSRLLSDRWRVEAVSDGKQALEAACANPPDLVLTDVMMPNLDGFGLMRALRADRRTKSIPIIMLSARAGEEAQVEGLESGADDYLVKPFSARELIARVSTRLQIARLQRVAEEERARLYEIFMQAPVPVAVLLGPELCYEVANPAYCKMMNRGELVGHPIREVFPELTGHASITALEDVVRTGEPYRVSELVIPLADDGKLRDHYFNFIAQPLVGGPRGTTDGVVIVAVELTEQVLARRRIEALRVTAENASRAKDDFLSTLSHELRTPLNAIVGWSTLLRQGTLPPERATRALETVERNARMQARLIDDMLDLSRIEQGKLVLSVGPVEMVRVVEAAIEAVRPAAEAKNVRLQPVLDSHAAIVGDPDRLQQIAWNLLSNAIKFTPKGGRVQVRLRRAHSFVELVVADNGQGIDQEFLPFVFERFRQADPSFTRRAGGLGLGLAIVRSLVELHGGTIDARSDGPGTGATFEVRLPMAPLRADSAPSEVREDTATMPRPTFDCPAELKGLRVLVVDDEYETRELLRYLIEQCEARVTTASGAAEALAVLAREPFDILVSDIGMPEVDGYGLIRSIRALPAEQNGRILAVALTAYARGEDRTKALRSGFTMHLAKPVEPGEMVAVLAAVSAHLDKPRAFSSV